MRSSRNIVKILIFALFLGLASTSSAQKRGRDNSQKLEEQRKRIEQSIDEEDSILDMLEEIDRSIQEKEAKLEDLRERQKAVETRIGGLEQERIDLEQGLAERRIQLKKRLRALYKYSTRGFMQAIFAGGSGTDILKRTKYLQLIIRRDMSLITEQRESLSRFGEVKGELERERIQVASLTRKVEAQVTEAQEEQLKKKHLLKSVRRERVAAKRMLRELEAAAQALTRQVASLPQHSETNKDTVNGDGSAGDKPEDDGGSEGKKPEEAAAEPAAKARAPDRRGGRFSRQRGLLPFPVDKGKITKAFGRYKMPGMRAYDFNRGIDVTAPKGTPFKTIYTGEVKLAKWFKGYGLLMIIDHGNGFHSIYAHASKLLKKKGDRVETGNIVGLVGDTGSFQGPYLYLEVRKNGKAVNPLEWIRVPPDAMSLGQ